MKSRFFEKWQDPAFCRDGLLSQWALGLKRTFEKSLKSIMLESYGCLSANFLSLEKGENVVDAVRKLTVIVTTLVLLISVLEPAFADILVIQPDSDRGKDAFVYRAEPDQNYGNSGNLGLGIYQDSGLNEHRVFIQFSLSKIPLGSLVNSADLSLYHFAEENGYYYLTLDSHRVMEDWSETEVTWNNQPAFDPVAESFNFFDRYHPFPDWHSWNLTALTQSWMDGVYDNYGVSINVGQPSQGYSLKICHSSDYSLDPSLRPKLIVDYAPASALVTLEHMVGFVQRSREKNLINDDEVVGSLQEKLMATLEKLRGGKVETARNILNAFVNSIDAQEEKHIDGEVANTLINSAEYVMSF